MADLNVLGLGFGRPVAPFEQGTEFVLVQRPLQRVLAFRNRSIDDLVNSPVVKNEIYGYWKLYHEIQHHAEITDLERQWNPLGRRL